MGTAASAVGTTSQGAIWGAMMIFKGLLDPFVLHRSNPNLRKPSHPRPRCSRPNPRPNTAQSSIFGHAKSPFLQVKILICRIMSVICCWSKMTSLPHPLCGWETKFIAPTPHWIENINNHSSQSLPPNHRLPTTISITPPHNLCRTLASISTTTSLLTASWHCTHWNGDVPKRDVTVYQRVRHVK